MQIVARFCFSLYSISCSVLVIKVALSLCTSITRVLYLLFARSSGGHCIIYGSDIYYDIYYDTISQWPPLLPSIRRIMPSFWRFLVCFLTFLSDVWIIVANSAMVTIGLVRISSTITSLVFSELFGELFCVVWLSCAADTSDPIGLPVKLSLRYPYSIRIVDSVIESVFSTACATPGDIID